jgi:hypothetical protein
MGRTRSEARSLYFGYYGARVLGAEIRMLELVSIVTIHGARGAQKGGLTLCWKPTARNRDGTVSRPCAGHCNRLLMPNGGPLPHASGAALRDLRRSWLGWKQSGRGEGAALRRGRDDARGPHAPFEGARERRRLRFVVRSVGDRVLDLERSRQSFVH